MKRTLKFLARFYPESWRRRYGAEFDALLEDANPSLHDAFDILWGALKMQMTTKWGFGKTIFACSLGGIIVAAAITVAIPVHYVSQDMLTVIPADDTSLRVLDHLNGARYEPSGRDIFNQESLGEIIHKYNLYPHERAHLPLGEVIDNMRRGISVRPVAPAWPGSGDTLTFAIAFDYPDRQLAEDVGGRLLSAFIKDDLNGPHSRSNFALRQGLAIPVGPNRAVLAGEGLLVGLLGGAIVAFAARRRRDSTICPTCGRRVAAQLTAS